MIIIYNRTLKLLAFAISIHCFRWMNVFSSITSNTAITPSHRLKNFIFKFSARVHTNQTKNKILQSKNGPVWAHLSREGHIALLTRSVPNLQRDLALRGTHHFAASARAGGGRLERVDERRAVALDVRLHVHVSSCSVCRRRSSRRPGEHKRLNGVVDAHSAGEVRVELASAQAPHRRRLPDATIADYDHLPAWTNFI